MSATRSCWLRHPNLDAFRRYAAPASVKIAFNFRVVPTSGGTHLTTETRIAGTDLDGTRVFGRYWRVVYPGSAVLRQAWLDAVVRRTSSDRQSDSAPVMPRAPHVV